MLRHIWLKKEHRFSLFTVSGKLVSDRVQVPPPFTETWERICMVWASGLLGVSLLDCCRWEESTPPSLLSTRNIR